MAESQSQDTNQKTIRSIVKVEGKKAGQRSVSFKGVDFELLNENAITVQRSRKVGLFGIVRLFKQKANQSIGSCFNRLKEVTETAHKQYSKSNVNCLNTLFRLLSNKQLAYSLSSIKTSGSQYQSSSILPSNNSESNIPRSASTNSRLIKRSNGTQYYNSQSQRSLKQRPSFRSMDNKSVKSTDEVVTKQQSQNMMVLSEQAKKALLEMQRFDRFIYVLQSQKRLKAPIEQELKRLEKIKNHYKCMRDTYYDNELTITCLYNHMKNMYQMNRDLGEIVKLKAQIQKLQRKIIDNNVKHSAILKQLKVSNSNAKLAEDAAMLRQYFKMNNTLIGILKDTSSVEKTKNEIEALIKNTPEDRRELLCLIQGRISSSESSSLNNIGSIYYSQISKLLEDQNNTDKNIKNMERLKKSFAKQIQKCTNEEEHHTFDMLINLADKLNGLYTMSKSKDLNEIVNVEIKKLKLSNQALSGKIKQLQTRLLTLTQIESSVKNFEELIITITKKIQLDQNYLGDVVKNKRILSGKKLGISKLFSDILGLFEILNKGDKKKQLQSIESRIKQLQELNKVLSQQLSSFKTNPQTLQFTKFTNLFSPTIQIPQLTKISKYIELNKKKLPSYQPLLLNISSLITSILQNQKQKKILQTDNLQQSNQKRKELANMEMLFSNVIRVLQETNSPTTASKIRKIVDTQLKKSQHSQIQYEFNPMYKQSLKSLSLISQLLESSSNESIISKTKEELERSIRSNQNQFNKLMKVKDDEIERLREEIEIINIRFNDEYQKMNASNQNMVRSLEDQNNKDTGYQHKISELRRSNQELQRLVNQSKVDAQIMGVLKSQSQELKVLKVQISKLKNQSQQLNRLKNQNLELSRLRQDNQQLNKLRLQSQQYQRNSSQLKQSNATLSTQISQLQSELQSKVQSSNNLISRTQYNQLEQNNESLNRQIFELKNTINNLTNQLQDLNIKNSRFNNDLTNSNLQKQRLNQQIITLKRQNDSLQQTTIKLNSSIESLKLQSQHRSNSLHIPRHSNNHIQIHTTTTSSNQNKQKYYQQLYHSCKDQNQQLRYQLADLRSRDNSTISRPSIMSSMNLTDNVIRDQNDKLTRNVEEYLVKIERYEKERSRLIQQVNSLNYEKDEMMRSKDGLLREIDGYKSQLRNHQQSSTLSPSHSQVISSPTNGTRISSHLVIKADSSNLKINQLQKQIRRLNTVIKDLQTQNVNQANKYISVQQGSYYSSQTITSTQSPRGLNSQNTLESITREKLFLQSENKRLQNEVNMFMQKQRQLNDQSTRLNNELKRYQQDSYNTNSFRKQYEEAENRLKRMTDSHRLQVNSLNQSIRKLNVDNSSLSLRIRDIEYLPSLEENRKKSEIFLEQKVKSLESNTNKLNQFIKQLELRYSEQSKEVQKLRGENIFLQKKANIGGISRPQGRQLPNQFQDKLNSMVLEKTTNLERIETLENILNTKDIKISKILQLREVTLREIIFEFRKTQAEIRKVNQSIRSDKLVYVIKNFDSLMGKYQIQLLDAIKQKAQQTSFYMESSKKKRYSTSSLKSSEFIQNTNIVLHNLLVFLTSEKWLLEHYNNELPQESQYYFQQVEKFLIDLFQRVFESKNEVLDKQAHQLLMLRQKMQDLIDQQISEIQGDQSFRQQSFDIGDTKRKASMITLQHLFKLYMKHKSPVLLKEILNLLNIDEDN